MMTNINRYMDFFLSTWKGFVSLYGVWIFFYQLEKVLYHFMVCVSNVCPWPFIMHDIARDYLIWVSMISRFPSMRNIKDMPLYSPISTFLPAFCIFRKCLTLKVLNFWKFTSYCRLKPLWSGMGEVVQARTSPTLHPPSPPTVHQVSWLAL